MHLTCNVTLHWALAPEHPKQASPFSPSGLTRKPSPVRQHGTGAQAHGGGLPIAPGVDNHAPHALPFVACIYSPVGCEKEEAPVPTPTPTPVPTPTPTPTPTPSPNPQPTPNPVPQPGCKSASGALTAFGTHPDVRNAAGAYSATVLFTNLCMPTSQAEFCSPAYLAANGSTIQALIDRAFETVPEDLDVEYEGALVGQTCTFSGGSGTFTETSRLKWVNARTGASGQGDYHQSFTIRFN